MHDRSTTDAASRLTRAALLALAAYALPAAGPAVGGVPAAEARQISQPSLYAVKVHADWCVTCRKVGRIFDDLAARLSSEPVMFVEMDITNPSTIRQSEYLAAALGLSEAWDAGKGAGYILLVDARSRAVVGRMNVDLSLDELERRTKDAL